MSANNIELPPTTWARIYDFLPYQDVRSLLQVSRSFALEVPQYVDCLTIQQVSELHVAWTHRFANVSRIRIYCLFSSGEIRETSEFSYRLPLISLSSDAVTRIVPFLSRFPRLALVFIGGMYRGQRPKRLMTAQWYSYSLCTAPTNHHELYKNLVQALCGAFNAGMLSSNLDIRGILAVGWINRDRHNTETEGGRRPCPTCLAVCQSFPLPFVLGLNTEYSCVCIDDVDRLDRMSHRLGGTTFLQSAAPHLHLLGKGHWLSPRKRNKVKGFKRDVYSFNKEVLDKMELMRDRYNCDPSQIDAKTLFHALSLHGQNGDYPIPIVKSKLERLISIGYQVKRADFIAVEDDNYAISWAKGL